MNDEKKFKGLEFARSQQWLYFSSSDGKYPITRTITSRRIDDDFTLWLATGTSSKKIDHIARNPNVSCLLHSNGSCFRIFGQAEVVTDREMKESVWEEELRIHWTEGIDDPEFTVLKVTHSIVDFMDGDIQDYAPTELLNLESE